MKTRFKYILSTLLLLSIIVLGENITISCPNIKYVQETEWLSQTDPITKDSECFNYYQYFDVASTDLNTRLWSNEHIIYYNQIENIKLVSQTKIFCEIKPISLLFNRSYIPRKSIENHPIS